MQWPRSGAASPSRDAFGWSRRNKWRFICGSRGCTGWAEFCRICRANWEKVISDGRKQGRNWPSKRRWRTASTVTRAPATRASQGEAAQGIAVAVQQVRRFARSRGAHEDLACHVRRSPVVKGRELPRPKCAGWRRFVKDVGSRS